MKSAIIFIIFGLINYSQQNSICNPSCNGTATASVYTETCCMQASHILALTAASAKASTQALASAVAAILAGAGVTISANVAAVAGAQAGVVHSIAIALETGNCCEISPLAHTDARACDYAVTNASIEAQKIAYAASNASSMAGIYAVSASEISDLAQSLIKSTCCNFTSDIYNAVQIVGTLSTNAMVVGDAAMSVSSEAKATAMAASNTAASVSASVKVLTSNSIENCCSDFKTQTFITDIFTTATLLTRHVNTLTTTSQSALTLIENSSGDPDSLAGIASLVNTFCTSECANTPISCCKSTDLSCCASPNSIKACQVTETIARPFLLSSGLISSVQQALTWSKSAVIAITAASTESSSAIKQSSTTKDAVKVSNKTCCLIQVKVQMEARQGGLAVSTAIKKVKAAAIIYSDVGAEAYAVAQATSSVVASGLVSSKQFNDECCNKACCGETKQYPHPIIQCCQISSSVSQALYTDNDKVVESSIDKVLDAIKGGIKTADLLQAESITKLSSMVTEDKTIPLKCCCCKDN